jgi:predicted transcriptional regulator
MIKVKNFYAALTIGLLILTFFPLKAVGAIVLGSKPPPVTLSGESGGKIDGTPWSSHELNSTVWILFYVDPDRRDDNLEFEKALKNANFDGSKIKSVGIINFAATWIPDSILTKTLEAKKKEYPMTTYVRDLGKKIVSIWGVKDNSYNTMILNPRGEVVYFKTGPIDPDETLKVVSLIRNIISS